MRIGVIRHRCAYKFGRAAVNDAGYGMRGNVTTVSPVAATSEVTDPPTPS
jgi:hypothetical protein